MQTFFKEIVASPEAIKVARVVDIKLDFMI